MARIQIDFPEDIIFEMLIPVRITDINYGGHLANDKILQLIHEARVQFLKQFGFSEKNINGTALIMGDAAIVYKEQSYYGDKIKIKIAGQDVSRSSFDLVYQLCHFKTDNIIALAKTGMVCYDYKNQKVKTIPQQLKDILLNI